MGETRGELRAKLQAQANEMIEQALERSDGLKRITAIEALVAETRRQIGQELAAELLAER